MMKRFAPALMLTTAIAASAVANAQQSDQQPMPMQHNHQQHMQMMMNMQMQGADGQFRMDGIKAAPTQAGQSAFAAIQEIVEILEADPNTNWDKVDIEALRQHLIDMDNMTLHSNVVSKQVDGGIEFTVTGDAAVAASIKRMVTAHSMTMNGIEGWQFEPSEISNGAVLVVKVPAADLPKLKALGFIGVMTTGMHHQVHHLAIAKGDMHHN